MNSLLIGLLSIWAAANQAADASERAVKNSGVAIHAPNPNDPVEREYLKLLEEDDAAQEEVDKWIRDEQAFAKAGAGISRAALGARIDQRFGKVRKAYKDFLFLHPKHARARLAYGSFLNETGEEDEAVAEWERARELDPKNPAAWNNLANHYGHHGPVDKAFAYYEKAIEINASESTYHWNLATTVYLFRRDAMEYYKFTETQVFDRALELYRKALQLDPKNFILAHDYAQSYYGIKPLRTAEALAAWQQALKLANDDVEREGIYLHLARVELNSGLFEDSRKHLGVVTNQMHLNLKNRLLRNLTEKQTQAQATNAPAPKASPPK